MSAYSDKAATRGGSLMESLYESVRESFPHFIVHEMNDAIETVRAYLAGNATTDDETLLTNWTQSTDTLVWDAFAAERMSMHHTYKLARQAQGNLYRSLQVSLVDKTDAEVDTIMLAWCDTVTGALSLLPISAQDTINATRFLDRLKDQYGIS